MRTSCWPGRSLIPERYRARFRAGVAELEHGGKPVAVRMNGLRADGTEVAVELTPVPVRSGGRTYFCGFARDLSQIERAGAARRCGEARRDSGCCPGWRRLVALTNGWVHGLVLFTYVWLAACMGVAYLAKVVEPRWGGRFLAPALIYVGGYGPLLCAITTAAYVQELRGADARWEKTEKTGKVVAPA